MRGLSEKEARRRLRVYGYNEIRRYKRISPWEILLDQFKSPVILLLLASALVSILLGRLGQGSYLDGFLILVIVFLSAMSGFFQDYKAERTVEALQKMNVPLAKVIREGKLKEIPAREIVPGDIVVLEEGDVVPADGVIVRGSGQFDESFLTGESGGVYRGEGDEVFAGSALYTGEVIVKVTATGMKTKLGRIAREMQEIETGDTPFQVQMKRFARRLTGITAAVALATFVVAFHKFGIVEALLLSVSLAVAAIPEDLPAVLTITLSLGARSMAHKNALVRRLAVTESVGTVDIICTDKTGTLTEGSMRVKETWYLDKKAEELGYLVMGLCNEAKKVEKEGTWIWVGDDTDVALKIYSVGRVKGKWRVLDKRPFSPERKMMSVRVKGEKDLILVKGAPEVILERSTRVWVGKEENIEGYRDKIRKKNDELASKGYRILALAYKEPDGKDMEEDLVFLGLVILEDPPRPGVRDAVEECHRAGIRVVMITGDNPHTALAVAEQVGIFTEGFVTGDEIDKMSDEELRRVLDRGVNVFARTSPFHKLRILEILQEEGHTVAMTGDGVNDALALKKADVGIAMGIRGTEVAKEASDIILLDDNFVTIKDAIKEGRRIFDNIRKFTDYLLTCNTAEVTVVLLTTFFLPYILLYPSQILWINLITDGLPAVALALDPARPGVMNRKPRRKEEPVINRRLLLLIGGIGIKKALVILGTFLLLLPWGPEIARTGLFTAFILYEFVRIAVIRYNEGMLAPHYWLENKFLLLSLLGSFLLQLTLLYTPLSSYFHSVPLPLPAWLVLVFGTAVGFALGILISWIVARVSREEY